MKKFLTLLAFAAFISIQSASAQTPAAKATSAPVTSTPAAASSTNEVKSDMKEKSCHDASAQKGASCCQKKAEASNGKKASCCAKHEEKAEVKEEKAKGLKD